MKIVAYAYSDLLLEPAPDPSIWCEPVERIYQDLGGRQQLNQLIQDCQTDPPQYVLIRGLAELGDSVEDVCQRLTQLDSFGVQIKINAENSSAPSTVASFLNLLNEIKTIQHSRSIRKGHARNRIKALPPPGKAPYGYRRGKDRYVLDRSATPVVKEFFEYFLLYGSLRGAVRYLAKKYGKKISVSTGRRWLTNPVYRGDLEYQNGQVISNTHLPIISREEAAQVDRLLRRNRRLPPRTASAPRSLAGLVVCGECRSPMTVAKVSSRNHQQDYLYLRPIHCPKTPRCKALAYEQVFTRTIEEICRNLPLAVAQLQMPDGGEFKKRIMAEIAEKQAILQQLLPLTESGILDPETSQFRAYKLQTDIAELQSQLAQFPPVNLRETVQAVSIPQFWLDLSESERRFYFREFIRAIEIQRDASAIWQLKVIFIF